MTQNNSYQSLLSVRKRLQLHYRQEYVMKILPVNLFEISDNTVRGLKADQQFEALQDFGRRHCLVWGCENVL
jgi:hypothetical protein